RGPAAVARLAVGNRATMEGENSRGPGARQAGRPTTGGPRRAGTGALPAPPGDGSAGSLSRARRAASATLPVAARRPPRAEAPLRAATARRYDRPTFPRPGALREPDIDPRGPVGRRAVRRRKGAVR